MEFVLNLLLIDYLDVIIESIGSFVVEVVMLNLLGKKVKKNKNLFKIFLFIELRNWIEKFNLINIKVDVL